MFRGAFVSMPPEWRAPVSDHRRGNKAGSRPGSGSKPPPPPPFGVVRAPRRQTAEQQPSTCCRRAAALVALALAALALAAALAGGPRSRGRGGGDLFSTGERRRRLLDGLPAGALAVAFPPPPPAAAPRTPAPPPPIQDSALRAFAALCATGRETYVVMDRAGGRAFSSRSIEALGVAARARGGEGATTTDNPTAACPLADIMLAGADRSLGLCTDAAIYAWLLGARVLPLGTPLGRYGSSGGRSKSNATNNHDPCASHPAPARLSLEPLYARWVLREELGEAGGEAASVGAEAFAREGGGMGASGDGGSAQRQQRGQRGQRQQRHQRRGGGGWGGGGAGALLKRPRGRRRLAARLLPAADNAPPRWWSPNPENQPLADRDLHARMDAVLCKTRACERMMLAYMRDLAGEVAAQAAANATAQAPPPPAKSPALVLFAGHTSLDPLDAAAIRQLPLIARAPGPRRPAPDLPPEEEDEGEPEGEADAREAAAVAALLAPSTLPLQQGEPPEQPPSSSSSPPVLLLAAEWPGPLRALHVRGKSGLKHTAELLACWYGKRGGGEGAGGGRGDKKGAATAKKRAAAASLAPWPELDVVGPVPNPQVPDSLARTYLAANVRLPLQQLLRAAGAGAARAAAATSPPFSFASVAALQRRSAVHVCPSEREGFGHYVNEARAVGALVVAPAHAPLDELVWEAEEEEHKGEEDGTRERGQQQQRRRQRAPQNATTTTTGVLIRPAAGAAAYFSQDGPPVPALARYANLSVRLSPADICGAAQRALSLPEAERAKRGQAARAAFLEQRRALERRFFGDSGGADHESGLREALWRQLVEAGDRGW